VVKIKIYLFICFNRDWAWGRYGLSENPVITIEWLTQYPNGHPNHGIGAQVDYQAIEISHQNGLLNFPKNHGTGVNMDYRVIQQLH